jgi:hypothetical protein
MIEIAAGYSQARDNAVRHAKEAPSSAREGKDHSNNVRMHSSMDPNRALHSRKMRLIMKNCERRAMSLHLTRKDPTFSKLGLSGSEPSLKTQAEERYIEAKAGGSPAELITIGEANAGTLMSLYLHVRSSED